MSGSHSDLRAAFDPKTPVAELLRLAQSEDETIRGAVAFATGAPADVFGMLGADKGGHVRACLKQRSISRDVRLAKPRLVTGRNVKLRHVRLDDSAFIAELRNEGRKARFISATSNDEAEQLEWLRRYEADDAQVYFIIEDQEGRPIGTVRLYDPIGCSFCWGSWILKDGLGHGCAIESALLVYRFALSRGFTMAHFDVRRDNTSVWKFHERFGAKRVAEGAADYFYRITRGAIEASMKRFERFTMPDVAIVY